jgi:hypothetical protein
MRILYLAAGIERHRATADLFYYFNERLSNHFISLAAIRLFDRLFKVKF